MLSIEAYDQAEAEARKTASYPAIRAFTPTTFLRDGTPTRAACEEELARYVDMMGEIWGFKGWDDALFHAGEAREIYALRDIVKEISGVTPICNLLSPWPILRAVRHLAQGRKLRIFEIAAGCGYLGAYLIKDGHDYTGTDVTQGLYLWQNRLWGSLYRMMELAENGFWPAGTNAHVPWWIFAEPSRIQPDYDVVICDSALGEMGWFGYAYVLHAAAEMIGNEGYFVFSNIGDHAQRLPKQVDYDVGSLGLKIAFTTPQGVQFWSRSTKRFTKMDAPHGVRLSSLGLIPDILPANYSFLKFAGLC